jgi:REP element-mobilizing transposase RayT
MARKPRVELRGGLYHVITRGNDRQTIFHRAADYQKFLALLTKEKQRLPFYLYAYCLMPNHVHLLIERQVDDIGRIMHRLLTGYSQYFNRRYRKVGHVLQGRHKAILCQTETYLAELVRYIHLNPVRAKLVRRPEQYEYSSHRNYLGLQALGIVDVDPVLRHFGNKRELARQRYKEFIVAGMRLGHREEFYQPHESILGTEEFVDATIHRIGEQGQGRSTVREPLVRVRKFDGPALVALVEKFCGIAADEFCGVRKHAAVIRAKEAVILIGRKEGGSVKELSVLTGLSSASVSRRYDIAVQKLQTDEQLRNLIAKIVAHYLFQDQQES